MFTYRFGLLAVGLGAAAIVAACSQAGVQAPAAAPGAQSPPHQSIIRNPVPNATPTPVLLIPGEVIGTPYWPDGDTQQGGQGQQIDKILNCLKTMPNQFHIHIHLSIYDQNGLQLQVPWGIGIVPPWGYNSQGNFILTGQCFYNLHVHDKSGVIHDEAIKDNGYTLGNFFDVWGMPLSTTQVATLTGTVWVKIITPVKEYPWSNTIDPRTILLTEHEQINLAMVNQAKNFIRYKFNYK
jgi:hypothetical protein